MPKVRILALAGACLAVAFAGQASAATYNVTVNQAAKCFRDARPATGNLSSCNLVSLAVARKWIAVEPSSRRFSTNCTGQVFYNTAQTRVVKIVLKCKRTAVPGGTIIKRATATFLSQNRGRGVIKSF